MWEELEPIQIAIDKCTLPTQFDELFARLWDGASLRFQTQETYIIDYKETYPDRYTDAYGSGIVRLALGMFNAFGGIVIFGVRDRTLNVVGVPGPFDIESFNRALSDFTGIRIECIARLFTVPGIQASVAALLIPRRGLSPPARLLGNVGKYPAGSIWIRERHEVLEAETRHLASLYSDRLRLPSDAPDVDDSPVHRSLPPSPSTIKDFIGRFALMDKLWDWMVFGDQPRLYLDGPGGSGKTTLAFEFSKLLVDSGPTVRLMGGEKLDYVIFITAKEKELISATGKQQLFKLQNFSTARQQFAQILYHSGLLDVSEIDSTRDERLDAMLDELFATFNGLIVIDDIDSLSRRKVDTGEETLLIKAIRSQKRTRILYTLRYPAAYAFKNSLTVPGLDQDTEGIPFIQTCCRQFGVPAPSGEQIPMLFQATSCLPLILETVIGLRKFAGNYSSAIREYQGKGGREARQYLYQREYDQLDPNGRSRYVLAGLYLVEEPMSFTTICSLFQFSTEQVRDALTECSGIFLSTIDLREGGETLYQLTPPAAPFVQQVSERLSKFEVLKRTVEHFKTQGSRSTPEERAAIVAMDRLIRQERYQQVVDWERGCAPDDPILVNPHIRSLLGQAWSALGPTFRENARSCFKAAESVGFHDVYMMRRWYFLELDSGYGLTEAQRICNVMISDGNLSAKYRSEFWSKLGNCFSHQSQSYAYTDREKCISALKNSVKAYLEALWVGRETSDFEPSRNLAWMERPLQRLATWCQKDGEELFSLMDALAEEKHDIDLSGAALIVNYLLRLPASNRKEERARVRASCNRAIGKIKRAAKTMARSEGLLSVIGPLETLRQEYEAIDQGG